MYLKSINLKSCYLHWKATMLLPSVTFWKYKFCITQGAAITLILTINIYYLLIKIWLVAMLMCWSFFPLFFFFNCSEGRRDWVVVIVLAGLDMCCLGGKAEFNWIQILGLCWVVSFGCGCDGTQLSSVLLAESHSAEWCCVWMRRQCNIKAGNEVCGRGWEWLCGLCVCVWVKESGIQLEREEAEVEAFIPDKLKLKFGCGAGAEKSASVGSVLVCT